MNRDLQRIKKKFGEKMSHFCREHFSTILEREGVLSSILENHFEPNHNLYDDIIQLGAKKRFVNQIYFWSEEKEAELPVTNKMPQELLREVGYTLYECKNESDIQSFKKYYAEGEKLCTFHTQRLNRCIVFFAVHERALDLNRKDFLCPKRQDAYGTSVISIQFTHKKPNRLSIKNRYNHMVENPDATFSNNLENIIPGLTRSFEKYYHLNIKNIQQNFELAGYVLANDGKFYKYNYEIHDIYYCPHNIIIDKGEVIRYKEERFLLCDYFLFDIKNKTLHSYDKDIIQDSFQLCFQNIENIKITKTKDVKQVVVEMDGNKQVIIHLNSLQQIVKIQMDSILEIGDNFLECNHVLKEFYANSLKKVGHAFLYQNKELIVLEVRFLEEVGNYFCAQNKAMKQLILPHIKRTGHSFFRDNYCIHDIFFPSLEEVADYFLTSNHAIVTAFFPRLTKVGNSFLANNEKICSFFGEFLEEVGHGFLYSALEINVLSVPKLKKVGNHFMARSYLKKFYAQSLEEVGQCCFYFNPYLKVFDAPHLKKIGEGSLRYNEFLRVKSFLLCLKNYLIKKETKSGFTLTLTKSLLGKDQDYK